MTVFGGDVILASHINRLAPEPIVQVSFASSSGAITTTEDDFLTLASTTFKANSAYEAILDAGYSMSVATNVPLLNLRKTNESGTLVGNFGPRLPAPGTTSATLLYTTLMFQIGSSDVTAVLCATAQASAGTVTIIGNGQRQRRLRIYYRGDASSYTNLPTLT